MAKIKAYHARTCIYGSYCVRRLGTFLPLPNGMLVHHRVTPNILIYTPGLLILLFLFCRLLSKDFVLLKCLGKYFASECTVGMNGRVWINSASTPHTIAIANAISNSEYMTNNQIETMVKQLVKGMQS